MNINMLCNTVRSLEHLCTQTQGAECRTENDRCFVRYPVHVAGSAANDTWCGERKPT